MTTYTVIPVEDLLPGEPCERWNEGAAGRYCATYNGAPPEGYQGSVFQPDSYNSPHPERTHAIVALPRPSKAPESPRYVVKRAEEMVPGEPYRATGTESWCDDWIAKDFTSPHGTRFAAKQWVTGSCINSHAAVDTHDDWHRARSTSPTPPPPVTPEPVGPTDTEVVAAYERIVQQETPYRSPMERIRVGAVMVEVADVYAARSRVLASRIAASKERERLSVLVDVQHEDYV